MTAQWVALPTAWIALALTIAIEVPILVALLVPRWPLADVVLTGVLINAFTHPLVWAYTVDGPGSWWAAEFFALSAETVLLILVLKIDWSRALLAAGCANVVTAAIGIWVTLP